MKGDVTNVPSTSGSSENPPSLIYSVRLEDKALVCLIGLFLGLGTLQVLSKSTALAGGPGDGLRLDTEGLAAL